MAIEFRIVNTTNNNILAARAIPPAALSELQAAWGDAATALDVGIAGLKLATWQKNRTTTVQANQTSLNATLATQEATHEAAWT